MFCVCALAECEHSRPCPSGLRGEVVVLLAVLHLPVEPQQIKTCHRSRDDTMTFVWGGKTHNSEWRSLVCSAPLWDLSAVWERKWAAVRPSSSPRRYEHGRKTWNKTKSLSGKKKYFHLMLSAPVSAQLRHPEFGRLSGNQRFTSRKQLLFLKEGKKNYFEFNENE